MKKADIGNFLFGFCIGTAAALLLAPQSGRTTRARITRAANDGKGVIRECGETAQDAVIAIMDRGKGYVIRQRRGVAEAIRRGFNIYSRAG